MSSLRAPGFVSASACARACLCVCLWFTVPHQAVVAPPSPFCVFVFCSELLPESHDCHTASLVANESQRVCTLTQLNDSSALNIAPKTTLKVLREVRMRIGRLRHDNHTQTHITSPKCQKNDKIFFKPQWQCRFFSFTSSYIFGNWFTAVQTDVGEFSKTTK